MLDPLTGTRHVNITNEGSLCSFKPSAASHNFSLASIELDPVQCFIHGSKSVRFDFKYNQIMQP